MYCSMDIWCFRDLVDSMTNVEINSSARTKEEIRRELTELFTTNVQTVYEVRPFDNSSHLGAWVTLEENDIGFNTGKRLREKGYYIANHESESRYEDEDRQSYLVILEEYEE